MSTKVLARIIIAIVIVVLMGIVYILWSDMKQEPAQLLVPDTPEVQEQQEIKEDRTALTIDRLKEMEDAIASLEEEVEDQESLIDQLTDDIKTSATAAAKVTENAILDSAFTKGSSFSTSSTGYSVMSMFVNVTCSTQCNLWIDFYTVSKNDTANNENTYGVFLNGKDQSIYTLTKMPTANGSVSLSLNDVISVGAGTHTVEIKAKTSGGTLTSDVSFLQVLAIER